MTYQYKFINKGSRKGSSRLPNPFVLQFESRFIPEPNSGCWLWLGGCWPDTERARLRDDCAARVSWRVYRGEILDGQFVLHKCDNVVCVNPDHLFLGDQAINVADARRKGRAKNGAVSGRFLSSKEIATKERITKEELSRQCSERNLTNASYRKAVYGK